MHRSRLARISLDHPQRSHNAALTFWAAALGLVATAEDEAGQRHDFGSIGPVTLGTQHLDRSAGPTVHLEIETDDVEAETDRLAGLGANVLERRDGYYLLVDPGGLPFSVVPVRAVDGLPDGSTTWP